MNFGVAKAIQSRNLTKAANILMGICSGIAADGVINDLEVTYLRTWLLDNQDACAVWPGNVIARRIDEILADGVITSEERSSLLECLKNLSGNHFTETGAAVAESIAIPFDDDPDIVFSNKTFCFTGKFYYGTRSACERVVLKLEAMPIDRVTKKLDYLVVGGIANPDWSNCSYGKKIEAAIKWQEENGMPTIISEEQWVTAVDSFCKE